MVVFGSSLLMWHNFPCLTVLGPALPMQSIPCPGVPGTDEISIQK